MEPQLFRWIVDETERRNWSNNELAKRAGLSPSYVSMVLSGQRSVTFDFCAGIAKAFGERPEVIFRKAGLLPTSSGKMSELSEDEKELVEAYRELSPGLKPVALGLLKDLLNRWREVK
jgi:transcriptional regulator with XRE-family HTH domain